MMRRGPLLTLAAAAALGIGLLFVNISNEEDAPDPAAVTSVPAAPAPATSAPPAPAAEPSAKPFPPKADYVGQVPIATGQITLEVTVQGDKAVAYACDGNTIETWLQGTAKDGTVALTGKNDAKLDGVNDGGSVNGTLEIGGKSWKFTSAPVAPPAGLYISNESGTRTSWIVDGNGAVTGVQRAPDGTTSAAPMLRPDGTAVVGGVTVQATQVSGGDQNVF